ncbi:trimeric intracellular cation channel family protein [Alicyclobacillus herbarius]|uniref:trimeric intracellular cation channel family protein n=1 Tax=Alicyclobacillus herbarius TaxID=122960 RepID=UPI00041B69B8|nr:TRIC cation channel family protein [Alicyclobacillus herbarius]
MDWTDWAWPFLHAMGTIAYAASGAFVAFAARYRLVGVYVLGLVTSFGGGVIRNTLIGLPVNELWDKQMFLLVLVTLTVLYVVSKKWLHYWRRWGYLFDSIGLASFSLQGALYASQVSHNLFVIVAVALFAGVGGGMIRDVLAGRKPVVLQEQVPALLTGFVALTVWLGGDRYTHPLPFLGLVTSVVILRMLSIQLNWRQVIHWLQTHMRNAV